MYDIRTQEQGSKEPLVNYDNNDHKTEVSNTGMLGLSSDLSYRNCGGLTSSYRFAQGSPCNDGMIVILNNLNHLYLAIIVKLLNTLLYLL